MPLSTEIRTSILGKHRQLIDGMVGQPITADMFERGTPQSFCQQTSALGKSCRTCGSVPCDCGRNQGFGPTGSPQRRVSGDCSTTTSSRKNHGNWYRNRRVGRARRGVGLSAVFFFWRGGEEEAVLPSIKRPLFQIAPV